MLWLIDRSVFPASGVSTNVTAPRRMQMGKIVVSYNVSLDGIGQDPTGEEGFKHGGWFSQTDEADLAAWAKAGFEEAMRAEALLLGRRSDEYFGPRWRARTGDWADRLNSLPKYVVSSTLEEPRWTNVTVLRGDVADEVARLKQEIDGEILLIGSRQLVQTLMEHELVDELQLTVFPVVLGSGERLFGESAERSGLRLREARTIGDGLVFLNYEVVPSAVGNARSGAGSGSRSRGIDFNSVG
jgi:dihydrofolate reductase